MTGAGQIRFWRSPIFCVAGLLLEPEWGAHGAPLALVFFFGVGRVSPNEERGVRKFQLGQGRDLWMPNAT